MQVRHPNVLAFKFTSEVDEKGETVISLVTEAVKPLKHVLDTLDLDQSSRSSSFPSPATSMYCTTIGMPLKKRHLLHR